MGEQFIAVSGGADSTAMALRMSELGEVFSLIHTPTGNELGNVKMHVERLAEVTGAPLVLPPAPTLEQRMEAYKALPSHRMRWCTREIKIVPCARYLKARPGSVLCVGLRADEESREGAPGLYGDTVTYRTPLREWGWTRADVLAKCRDRGMIAPPRTDCAWCYDQRLTDWWRLWREHPESWARAEEWEARTGHTFRSPHRDTWPAALTELRARFERGDQPRGLKLAPTEEDDSTRCRVCVG